MAPSTVEILVCTRCRQGQEIPEDAERPGAALYRALSDTCPESIRVTPVECLSNCSRGCTVALRGTGRWTYVYGGLDPATGAATVAEGALRYAATADGLVPWRERPEHFRKNCIARIPPLDPAIPNLGAL
jgi:predicted metal-binding protein